MKGWLHVLWNPSLQVVHLYELSIGEDYLIYLFIHYLYIYLFIIYLIGCLVDWSTDLLVNW